MTITAICPICDYTSDYETTSDTNPSGGCPKCDCCILLGTSGEVIVEMSQDGYSLEDYPDADLWSGQFYGHDCNNNKVGQ